MERLVKLNRVSKPLESYTQNTQNVAALERACDQDLAVHPGQNIEYMVVDDEKSSRGRLVLAHEENRGLQRLILRDSARQSCRECVVTARMGPNRDPAGTLSARRHHVEFIRTRQRPIIAD
jgi:hypothetical protein